MLQLKPHLSCSLTIHDAAGNINMHGVDQPRKHYCVTAFPIFIQGRINIRHCHSQIWLISLDKRKVKICNVEQVGLGIGVALLNSNVH